MHAIAMEGLELPLNASSSFYQSPLSSTAAFSSSSPSPSPSAPGKKRTRRLILRLIWPFKCSRFAVSDDGSNGPRNGHVDAVAPAARRLRLEELLKLEAKDPEAFEASPYVDDDGERTVSLSQGSVLLGEQTEDRQVELVVGRPAVNGVTVVVMMARMELRRFMIVLAELQARSRAATVIGMKFLMGSKGKVTGGGGGGEELFYERRISLGCRCRVQHLEESPFT